MDLIEAAAFVRVVQAGSFSRAARQLGLPISTVSTRVARLEMHLGMTLLQRTTRRLRLTEIGDLYYRHASAGLKQMLEAEAAVTESTAEPKGLLRVTAPTGLGEYILPRLIIPVCRAYPKIDVELFLTKKLVDLVADAIDIAIRVGVLSDSTLIAKQVGVSRWALFASQRYLKTAPLLAKPQHLSKHTCLQFASLGREQWTLTNAKGSVTVPMKGRIVTNDLGIIQQLAAEGEGIALLPTYLSRPESKKWQLVPVLPEWRAKIDPVHLVYPQQRFVPPKTRAFLDIAEPTIRKLLE